MFLSSIHVYPVKGARGIALPSSDVLAGGLRHDRRFMVVSADGTFLTQREYPVLATVEVAFRDGGLALTTSGGTVVVSLAPEGPRMPVTVWDDRTEAVVVPGAASELVSAHVGAPVTLVFMPDDVIRPVDPTYGHPGDRVGFADGFPVLVATEASLADLNARLDTPVPMDRFRPNLVVRGGEAWEEERFARVVVGAVAFRMPKRCARCPVVTVDQATGVPGKEPLRTLAKFRSSQNKVYFAQNLIPDGTGGRVTVGDAVTYAEPR